MHQLFHIIFKQQQQQQQFPNNHEKFNEWFYIFVYVQCAFFVRLWQKVKMTTQYVEIINEIVQKKAKFTSTTELDTYKKNKQIEKNALAERKTNVTYRNEKQYII